MPAAAARHTESIAGLTRSAAIVFAVLFLGASIVYGVIWPSAPLQEGDSPQYLAVARDLADFRLDTLHDRTPLYPALLALTGSADEPTRALLVVSLALHCASVWLLAVILHAAGAGSRWLIAFAGIALLPPYVEPAGHVMTESFAQFWLAVGLTPLVMWFVRKRAWLLGVAGLAFGLAALTRPIYQALTVALAGCLLVLPAVSRRFEIGRRDVFAAIGAVVAGALLTVGSLAMFNHRTFNYFGLTPTLGFHLSTKTVMFVERLPEEYGPVREILVRVRDAELTKRGGPHTGTQAAWTARSDLEAATGLTTPGLSAYLVRMNLTLIRRAPIEYLQDVARSLALYWFPPAGPLADMNSSVLRWSWAGIHLIVIGAFWIQITVLAGVSIFSWSMRLGGDRTSMLRGRIRPIPAFGYLLAGTIVFYTMGVSCLIDIGEMRQRRSTDLLIILMAFLGALVWKASIAARADVDGAASHLSAAVAQSRSSA